MWIYIYQNVHIQSVSITPWYCKVTVLMVQSKKLFSTSWRTGDAISMMESKVLCYYAKARREPILWGPWAYRFVGPYDFAYVRFYCLDV
jgi:hypothetical protein